MMLDFYDVIAEFYDQFQDFDASRLPELWAEFLDQEFKRTISNLQKDNVGSHDTGDLLALDLGCGTGSVTLAMADRGWKVIGVDNSSEMLEIANSKIVRNDSESVKTRSFQAEFILDDICDLDLDEKVDLIYTSLDVFNHLDEDEIVQVLQKSCELLKNKGILIFDLHSLDYMQDDLGNNIYHSVTDDYVIIWENDFSDSDLINEATITTFKRETDGIYIRKDSSLLEYYHYPNLIKEYLEFIGMSVEFIENTEFTDMWDGKRIFIKATKI